MPSPFPGMNPYLEQEDVWHDFHERFIPLVATLLGSQLRPRSRAMRTTFMKESHTRASRAITRFGLASSCRIFEPSRPSDA
jgi:hypothetical protein